VDRAGEPWFVGKDSCDVLGLVNSRDAIAGLDPDEKDTVVIPDGIPGTLPEQSFPKLGFTNSFRIPEAGSEKVRPLGSL